MASLFIVDLEEYDIAKKTIHYFQVKHVIEKPKRNAEAEENLSKELRFHGWFENSFSQNFSWAKATTTEDMSTQQSETRSSRKFFSNFQ